MQNLKYSDESKSLNKTLLLLANLIVAIIVFYFMGAKHTNIGFHADDYGFIYNGRYNSLQDIKTIFSNSDMITCAGTMLDKQEVLPKNFLETLYRPLVLLVMGTEYKFFGMNAYYFHLVHTALHTITTLTILNVITIYSGLLCAIPLALFWGLHTSLKDYFFWQCYVQNSLEAVLLCIMVLLFIMWYRRRWMPTLIGCLALFFITLLLRETLIVLPVLVGLFVFLEEFGPLGRPFETRLRRSSGRADKNKTLLLKDRFSITPSPQNPARPEEPPFDTAHPEEATRPSRRTELERTQNKLHGISKGLRAAQKIVFIFFIPIAGYMTLRLWAHPFSTSIQCLGIKNFSQTNHSLLQTINLKFFDWVAWFMDILGLHWLPKGYGLVKLTALITLGAFVVSMWYRLLKSIAHPPVIPDSDPGSSTQKNGSRIGVRDDREENKKSMRTYVIILTCGIILFSWPSLLLCHCSRYLYLPTLCFALLIGFLSSNLTQRSKNLFFALFVPYAMLQGVITDQRMQLWVARTRVEQIQIADGISTEPGISLYRKLIQ